MEKPDINRKPGPLDYERLKEYGLEYIQRISNKQWTDFNLHDPGVTILEALCFALTDLAYRTDFSLNDLLTPKGGDVPSLSGTLFPAHQILSHTPITSMDYRKFILESIPGIRNVWIEPMERSITIPPSLQHRTSNSAKIKGLYRIAVELQGEEYLLTDDRIRETVGRDAEGRYIEQFDQNYKITYQHYIRNFFLKHRNLCEDVEEVQILSPISVGICAEIKTEQNINYRQMLEEIYTKVYTYVSPSLSFYTLPELIKKGKTPEEMYQGLLPRYGLFVDMEELESLEKRTTLYISDILSILMKIPGVVGVSHVHFTIEDKDRDRVCFRGRNLMLKDHRRVLHFAPFSLSEGEGYAPNLNRISFLRNGFPIVPNLLPQCPSRKEGISLEHSTAVEFPIPAGRHRDVGHYYSFQHLFPKTYRMGYEGIPDSATNLRKAERMQLKGYLTFFDQLLADYLEQLNSLEAYFSVEECRGEIENTYFFHELDDSEIVEVEKLLKKESTVSRGAENRFLDLDRRNRLMDHLLARFNDSFADYSALAFLGSGQCNSFSEVFTRQEGIEDKKHLLRNYPTLSGTRSQAIDYTDPLGISGLERRILAKLGINKPNLRLAPPVVKTYVGSKGEVKRFFRDNRKDGYEKTFGIHIIEHLFLLPAGRLEKDNFLCLAVADDNMALVDDPYSLRATVLIPGWLDICQNMSFRQFVEETVLAEFPAHIAAKICWVDPLVMWRAEKAYKRYSELLSKQPFPKLGEGWEDWLKAQDSGIREMIVVFDQFRNIYPESKLPEEGKISEDDTSRLDFICLQDWSLEKGTNEWAFKKDRE